MKRKDGQLHMQVIASTQHLCPECRIVSSRGDLVMTEVACDNCGATGSRQIYPGILAITLTYMAKRYFARANAERAELQENLQAALSKIAGTHIPFKKTARLHAELRKQYARGLLGADEEPLYRIVADVLGITDRKIAMDLFVEIIGHSETTDDDKTVVVLTITLLERLFDDLLIEAMVKAGSKEPAARAAIKEVWSFERKRDKFKELTGHSFAHLMKKNYSALYQHWIDLAKVRHIFIHGNPYAIGFSHSKKADKLIDTAFSAFASVQNSCGIVRTAGANHSILRTAAR